MSAKTTVQDVDPLALERQVRFALAIANRAVLAVYGPLLRVTGNPVPSRCPETSSAARRVGTGRLMVSWH